VDRFGVKCGLILNFLGCATSYYLLSTVTTLDMLWLSKVPAMFMHGANVCRENWERERERVRESKREQRE